MIRHNPEWQFFALGDHLNQYSVSGKGDFIETVKTEWKKQFSASTPKASTLHHAALMFIYLDPAASVEMLQRAANLDPQDESIQRELGSVYALSLTKERGFGMCSHRSIGNEDVRAAFAPIAREAILTAKNPSLIHGALSTYESQLKVGCREAIAIFEPSIEKELKDLALRYPYKISLPNPLAADVCASTVR